MVELSNNVPVVLFIAAVSAGQFALYVVLVRRESDSDSKAAASLRLQENSPTCV